MKISVVLQEYQQKLRDHLLVNSQQFESNYNKLRAIIQAHLNTNKTWIVNDFREIDPMGVDFVGKSKSKGKSKGKGKSGSNGKGESKGTIRIATKAKAKGRTTAKARAVENLTMTKSATCAEKGHFARDCWSRANHDKMVDEVEVENANAESGKEYVYTIEH